MNIGPELVLAIVAQIVTAAGVYAAIRADLARAIERATMAMSAAGDAHRRIDLMLEKR